MLRAVREEAPQEIPMFTYPKPFDVIVVGAGHAGIEAAFAASRLGCQVLVLTQNLDTIGHMSCNPAIGGLAKGHIVREIDALGGEMARCIDETGIQFRRLNESRGPAVRATRAQADKARYRLRMKQALESAPNVSVKQGTVASLVTEGDSIAGVDTELGERFIAKSVILTTGTFLRGLMHFGQAKAEGGRAGDSVAKGLTRWFVDHGFPIKRMKTGTCPRLDRRTIDLTHLEAQPGDNPTPRFSFVYDNQPFVPALQQISCWMTYTSQKTHDVIKENLHKSAMYSGEIEGIGPRYCPSIEDKIVKFNDKDRHHIFLEPEGLDTLEIYPNGLSTSLPIDVQILFLRSIPGLENVEIMRPGYAVEYDMVPPTELQPWLETKRFKGLFHAGQLNGTSGYEEAAGQGFMAGVNAARRAKEKEFVTLSRDQAYLAVMIDDLVTKGVDEPYRMFTSRAEWRLLLRDDNADLRLSSLAHQWGLLSDERMKKVEEKAEAIEKTRQHLRAQMFNPTPLVQEALAAQQEAVLVKPASAEEILRRPNVSYTMLRAIGTATGKEIPWVSEDVAAAVEVDAKYEGYIQRAQNAAKKDKDIEKVNIPEGFAFRGLGGLSREVIEKLERVSPKTLGQASRISGVTPAAISILAIHIKAHKKQGTGDGEQGTV
jgi:tRNA uridine 5-carboxymethylaminomethyl modification enzyme